MNRILENNMELHDRRQEHAIPLASIWPAYFYVLLERRRISSLPIHAMDQDVDASFSGVDGNEN